ncbi:hypothetical protein [Flammeovirga pacifica]|uniref:Ig-like domain-containing protein n=1 Tax=Flammeovirga pacifica TaxID=915059 RepID=A0A1S1Z2V9_FLAPC|nr:hypothetical protein [Flammeovirga pacifica]OHX67581.1 hypothetical protein NH26_15100 [Flammeovirga pacifica]
MRRIFQTIYILFFCFSFTNVFGQFGVSIKNGDLINTREVQLAINIPDAIKMTISNDYDFYDAEWVNYQRHYFWKLNDGDGEKEIFLKFLLANGRETDVFVAYTILDTKPPFAGRVNFSRGNYTRNRRVEIDFKCKEATFMNISNSGVFSNDDWIPFRKHIHSWMLTSGDGLKKIHVKFKDNAGNETKIYTDYIKLDSKAPEPKFLDIVPDFAVYDKKNDIKYVNQHNKIVSLELEAKGAEYMKISNSMNFYGHKWRRYSDYLDEWEMEEDIFEGFKKVFVRFRDKAGNESKTISTRIYVDTKPPINPRISINNGDEFTKSTYVTLQLRATDAYEMRIANDKDFDTAGDWEFYAKNKVWELQEGPTGTREVWVSYRDKARNQSDPVKAEINFDKDPPTKGQIYFQGGITKTNDKSVKMRVSADGALLMKIGLEENFEKAHWREYDPRPLSLFLGSEGGTKKILVQFKDRANNLSEVFEKEIYQEISALTPMIVIDENQEYNSRNDGRVNLFLYCLNATKMKISSLEDFSDAEWIDYEKRIQYYLKKPDGVKKIYAKFKTKTNTESVVVNDQIMWDITPPQNPTLELKVLPTESRIYYTKDYIVKVKADEAVAMQITEDSSFYTASWKPYIETPFYYGMSVKGGPVGYRKLYIRFKDFTGNISEPISKKLYFDATAPQNLAVKIHTPEIPANIATPDNFYFIREVALNMEMIADSAYFMRVADNPTWQGAEWVPYQEKYNYALKGNEGRKVIYVQFKDDHDNVTRILKKNIIWDRDPPTQQQLIINKGNEYTRSEERRVVLNPICHGADFMVISNNPDFSEGYWTHYRSRVNWLLTEGDGEKTVYAKFYDYSGNESFETRSHIFLDRSTPQINSIQINSEDKLTGNPEVTLKIDAKECSEMIISNDYSFASPSTWEPYQREKKWRLRPHSGTAKVYIKVRNRAGQQSAPSYSIIELDTDHPILYNISINNGATGTEEQVVTVHTHASDDTIEMQLANSNNFQNSKWIPYTQEVEWDLGGRGRKYVYVRFRDEAGNVSKPLKAEILVYEQVK